MFDVDKVDRRRQIWSNWMHNIRIYPRPEPSSPNFLVSCLCSWLIRWRKELSGNVCTASYGRQPTHTYSLVTTWVAQPWPQRSIHSPSFNVVNFVFAPVHKHILGFLFFKKAWQRLLYFPYTALLHSYTSYVILGESTNKERTWTNPLTPSYFF